MGFLCDCEIFGNLRITFVSSSSHHLPLPLHLPHLVNLGVDDVELLHAEHAGHGPGLDGAQVGVVDGELPAVTINTQLLNL